MKSLTCFVVFSMFFILASNAAAVQNLSGKMLIFPEETDTAHMRMTPTLERFTAATVCQRFFSDLKRDHALFSMAVPNRSHGFTILVTSAPQGIKVLLPNRAESHFLGVSYAPNKWHSLCATWNSVSGLAQVWLNGNPLTIKSSWRSQISGKPIVTLGQDQGSYGSGFMATKSFVGMMTDVHMWDSALPPCEIQKFMKECPTLTPGNVLNWAALDFEINGRVVIENKQQTTCTCAS